MKVQKSLSISEPIFIGGLMKSGTSLLRVLLGQHPDLFASFETHWFSNDFRFNWGDKNSRRIDYLLKFFELNDEKYQDFCSQKLLNPQREFIDIVFEYMCHKYEKKRWVEKTPDNIRHWTRIQSTWPNAKLIHVTREYRDCYASWKARRGDNIEIFLENFDGAYNDICENLGRETKNYMEIDYNDLVTNTELSIKKVLKFLGARNTSKCYQIDTIHTAQERTIVKEVTGRDSNTSISLEKTIFSDSIGQWRSILTKHESEIIALKFAKYYEIFGNRWRYEQ